MFRMIGQISLFPYDFEPAGWSFCDGRVFSIADNVELFALLRNTFGGNADDGTFAVPELAVNTPAKCHYCISLAGVSGDVYEGGTLGETLLWPAPTNVQNLVECNGQSLPAAQYPFLRHYLGTRFGNQGPGNIVLPNLAGSAPTKCRYVMSVKGDPPDGGKQDAYVGEILLLPYELTSTLAREYFRLCNGDVLKAQDNPALAGLLGNRFGGDGEQTFALPKIPAPRNFNYYISLRGRLPGRS